MRLSQSMRTLIVATWIGALLYAGAGVRAGTLSVALALVWVAPLLRDRARGRVIAGAGAAG
ncbi:hypothetical protein AB0C07_37610 [Actinoplanes missouriensis]|uniref:hypothetical protein n=1 Tax=Actinoplanes missouriensis TaxID=1866 RepID=UPI0033DA17F9